MIVLVVDGGTYVREFTGDAGGSDDGDGRVVEPTKDGATEGVTLPNGTLATNDLAQHRGSLHKMLQLTCSAHRNRSPITRH